jgi:hypothetical protein
MTKARLLFYFTHFILVVLGSSIPYPDALNIIITFQTNPTQTHK